VSPYTSFALDAVFHLVPGRFERADLDNLAKPVLDTLFVSKDVQVRSEELTGALCQLDDCQVWRLTAEKRPVEDVAKEGVEVRLTWR
jgi:Holliday junction resolvase RusA-like endonuclease